MVRSPVTVPLRPSPHATAVLRKVVRGKASTSNSSAERRCSSRSGLPELTLAMPITTSTCDCVMSSATVRLPVTSVNRPRTLVTMKCRPVKATSA